MTAFDLAIGFAVGYVLATLTLSGIQYTLNAFLDRRRDAKELADFNKAIEKLKEFSDTSIKSTEENKPTARRKKTDDA